MSDKKEVWRSVTTSLEEINFATEKLEGFELSDEEQTELIGEIRQSLRSIRSVLHRHLRPDL